MKRVEWVAVVLAFGIAVFSTYGADKGGTKGAAGKGGGASGGKSAGGGPNGGPSGKSSAGVTSSGGATDSKGVKLGPSGEPMRHSVEFPTRKAAQDAAKQQSTGTAPPVEHPGHFHPSGPDGQKKPGAAHLDFPGRPSLGGGDGGAGGAVGGGGTGAKLHPDP